MNESVSIMQIISSCRICTNEVGNPLFRVREMQLGLRDEFEYFECSRCGCVQIQQFPDDLAKYYPNNYYSYRVNGASIGHPNNGISALRARTIVRILSRHYFFAKSKLGKLLSERSSLNSDYPYWVRNQKVNLKLRFNSRILDVGCGKGQLLLDFHQFGFTNLLGIDPFLEDEIVYPTGIRILKKDLSELSGQFDFVMLHHSFEHMPDPVAILKKLHELIKPKHYVLFRIPLAGSWAWREYGVNWASLDAPRHLFLHTIDSIKLLAKKCGFELAEVLFDSDGFAHWGSELYRRNIPLTDERSPWGNPNQSTFSKGEMEGFTKLDERLNGSGEADSAAFYLHRP